MRPFVLRVREIGLSDAIFFLTTLNTFLHYDILTPSMAPYAIRTHGPEWLTRAFPSIVEDGEETNEIGKAYLTPILLSVIISSGKAKDLFGLFSYQPSLVARQFGLCQLHPSSLLQSKKQMRRPQNEGEWRARLNLMTQNARTFTPLAFDISFACTKEFFMWWREYYRLKTTNIDEGSLLSNLIAGFPYMQNKKEKSKGTHI